MLTLGIKVMLNWDSSSAVLYPFLYKSYFIVLISPTADYFINIPFQVTHPHVCLAI